MLRASLREAVDEGLIPRSPAARVGLPRTVAKPDRVKETEAWTAAEVDRFLEASSSHRWAVGFRLGALYGYAAARSSHFGGTTSTPRLERCGSTRASWPHGPAQRGAMPRTSDPAGSSRSTTRRSANSPRRRAAQAAERLAAGEAWEDEDLIITTRAGRLVLPRSFDRALERIVAATELPRLTSHGLRHTAATHMVQGATDLGELRAIADLLGHSPEMLMNTYAHALPQSQSAVVERIGRRTT